MEMTDAVDVAEVIEGEIVETGAVVLATKTSIETLIDNGPAALPAQLSGMLDLRGWYRSLAYREPFVELDEDALMRKILLRTANAATPEELFEQSKPQGLQGLIRNVPGASSGPIRIDDLYVAKSKLETGVPCFMVLGLTSRTTGDTMLSTTGAQEVQMQVLGFLAFGIWPIECQIKRIDVQDKGGRYMLRLFPLD